MSEDIDLDDLFGTGSDTQNNKEYILSEVEKKKILDTWNSGKINLKSIIEAVFGEGFDGRTKQGMAAKRFLATRNLKANPAQTYLKKTDALDLSPEQRTFIENNCGSMKPLEMTRVLFKNDKLEMLSVEGRVVKSYYESLDPLIRLVKNEDTEEKEYRPPKTEEQAVARVNKYVMDGLDSKGMTSKQKDDIKRFIRVLHTHRVQYELNNLSKTKERELFESSFVRFIWDKPDLTEEEIDSYLNLCSDILNNQRMQKELADLIQSRDNTLEEEGKLPMPIVEAIDTVRKEIDQCFKRQAAASEKLNGKRSKRMELRLQENASILNLVEAFKDSYKREALIKLAEKRKDDLTRETDRLSTMDSLKFEIFGIGKRESN